ncbi:hypothetical protein RKD19_008028 [Streptomyces canus]|uniref:hypothetical protein n=1 Tax=Streptomyces sp. WSLK1-3 TaxID=3375475 RepID=UPI00379F7E44
MQPAAAHCSDAAAPTTFGRIPSSHPRPTARPVSGNGSGQDEFQVTGLRLENNWENLSNAATNSTQNHTSPNVGIGNGRFTTMQAIDAQLAVALRK